MLEASIQMVPFFALAKTPSLPLTTPSTSGESGTMVMTTSASLTASAMLVAPLPPSETSLSILSWLRLKPVTAWPALTRLMAMGRPMIPSPITATLLIVVLFLKV
jgi:hypothetical protein